MPTLGIVADTATIDEMTALQEQHGCESRSQLVALLVWSQRNTAEVAWRKVLDRPKRGRRWPIGVKRKT